MQKARVEYPEAFDAWQSGADIEDEPVTKATGPHDFREGNCLHSMRDKCSGTEAMSKARAEHPKEYADYCNT